MEQITELLKHKDYVRSISPQYKNHGNYNRDYRVYIETYDNPDILELQSKSPQITSKARTIVLTFSEDEYNTLKDLKKIYFEAESKDSEFIKRVIKLEHREKLREWETGGEPSFEVSDE